MWSRLKIENIWELNLFKLLICMNCFNLISKDPIPSPPTTKSMNILWCQYLMGMNTSIKLLIAVFCIFMHILSWLLVCNHNIASFKYKYTWMIHTKNGKIAGGTLCLRFTQIYIKWRYVCTHRWNICIAEVNVSLEQVSSSYYWTCDSRGFTFEWQSLYN